MYTLNLEDVVSIFQRDGELLARISKWNGKVSGLYREQLPAFEAFLRELPNDLRLEELDALLRKRPVDFRLLFASRVSQFSDRVDDGYIMPTYKSLSDFLKVELYENYPDKINPLS